MTSRIRAKLDGGRGCSTVQSLLCRLGAFPRSFEFRTRSKTFVSIICAACALSISTMSTAQTVSTIASQIQGSGGLAIGADGKIYISDFGSSLRSAGGTHILRIEPDGSKIEEFAGGFKGASGSAFGPDGRLYQSDVAGGQAILLSSDGERALIGSGLKAPVGIAPDGHGGAYVAECVRGAITHVAYDGTKRTVALGKPLNCPNGLVIGTSGALYTVNFRDGALVQIDIHTGDMKLVANIPGGGNGHITVANERFYIASFRGHRIYSVNRTGDICLIAGSGKAGNEDGTALTASFFRPNGVAVTRDGDTLYTNTVTEVVEEDSLLLHLNSIRRIDGLKSLLNCPVERRVRS